MIEVVSAGPGELAKLPFDLAEGLYVVGTGATGASEALAILGGVYFTTMFLSSFAMKKPHPSFVPPGVSPSSTPRDSLEIKPLDTALDLTAAQAMTKPQFYLLGTTFLCVATGGMGLFSVAKPLMSEVFSNMLPTVVVIIAIRIIPQEKK
jgi:hypothetical protein